MSSPVRTASNHYETLQVPPSATTDEIVEAFASHMRSARMRPDISVVRLAQLSVAYETLRDPAKRSNYDASIGIKPKPAPAPPPLPFIGAPVIARLNRISEPAAKPQLRQDPAEARSEPRVAAFIAASLREPAQTRRQSEPAPISRAEPSPPLENAIKPPPMPADDRLEIEDGRIAIGRTGATLAAGVIGVAILAFTSALPDRNPDRLPVQIAQAEPGLTVPIPPATAAKDSVVTAQPTLPTTIEAGYSPKAGLRKARSSPERKSPPATWIAIKDQQGAAAVGGEGAGQSVPTEAVAQQSSDNPSAAETPAAATTQPAPVSAAVATLPLSNATIARTIERIGYGCGRVVSSAGVEGTSGAFTITCSSGDTYRAAPVRGRYHFRRSGSH